MRLHRILVAQTLLLALTSGCWEIPADVPELGPLSMPAVVTGRDGGSAAMVHGRMLWTFNDTLMTVFGVDGFSYRPTTAGWADGASTHLTEGLDSNGAPYQLVPYTPEEIAYNRSHGPDDRFAMWPNAVVANGPDSALILFAYLKVLPGTLNYDSLGAGVAQIQGGQTVAVRQPGLLFANPEPAFQAGSIVVAGYLYLYACTTGTSCPVARAPLNQATIHDAWQAWTGTTWSSDLTAAVPVIPGPPGQLSVSWNAYLQSYLAVFSVDDNQVDYCTAPAPEGPWSAPTYLFTGRHGWNANYAALEHPELATNGGRTLVVSYADASEGFGSVIRLATPSLP